MAAEATAATEAPTLAEELETAAPVKAPPIEASAESPKPAKAEKSKKEKKSKKDKSGAEAESSEGEPSIAAHPRAVRAVARAKSWGGLLGFLAGGYLSLPSATPIEAGLRALAAGVVCYVVTWAGALFAWRRVVVIEIKAREAQLLEAAQAARAAREPGAGAGARSRASSG
ncbi:MAG TPA: hypothetical protein VGN25_02885 [Solirubrobacteraceae bacterium]|jgi:hypothetical protein|nr:hypothetical protein [Solirubrobacteraceae bacterium]